MFSQVPFPHVNVSNARQVQKMIRQTHISKYSTVYRDWRGLAETGNFMPISISNVSEASLYTLSHLSMTDIFVVLESEFNSQSGGNLGSLTMPHSFSTIIVRAASW